MYHGSVLLCILDAFFGNVGMNYIPIFWKETRVSSRLDTPWISGLEQSVTCCSSPESCWTRFMLSINAEIGGMNC